MTCRNFAKIREWRHIGDYELQPRRIVAILAPADDHRNLRAALKKIDAKWAEPPLLDPQWGLERMIATLAGIAANDIGPFPA